jgi:nucleoside-diphosphate-sugar epimerase
VAGGGGFVGSHVVDRIVESGAAVRVVGRSIEKAKRNLKRSLDKIELIDGDLRRLDDCLRSVRGREIVFNLMRQHVGKHRRQKNEIKVGVSELKPVVGPGRKSVGPVFLVTNVRH